MYGFLMAYSCGPIWELSLNEGKSLTQGVAPLQRQPIFQRLVTGRVHRPSRFAWIKGSKCPKLPEAAPATALRFNFSCPACLPLFLLSYDSWDDFPTNLHTTLYVWFLCLKRVSIAQKCWGKWSQLPCCIIMGKLRVWRKYFSVCIIWQYFWLFPGSQRFKALETREWIGYLLEA